MSRVEKGQEDTDDAKDGPQKLPRPSKRMLHARQKNVCEREDEGSLNEKKGENVMDLLTFFPLITSSIHSEF